MKKTISIFFSLLILVSGMQFTIATHFCGGVVAATKVSFSGELASCGMENSENANPIKGVHLDTKCCDDDVLTFSVDNNFAPSDSVFNALSQNILPEIFIPVEFSNLTGFLSKTLPFSEHPPGNFLSSAVSLIDICVFRI